MLNKILTLISLLKIVLLLSFVKISISLTSTNGNQKPRTSRISFCIVKVISSVIGSKRYLFNSN